MRVTAARAIRAVAAVLIVLSLGAGAARAASQPAVLAAFKDYRPIAVEDMTPIEMKGARPALKFSDKKTGFLLYLVGPKDSVEEVFLMIPVTRDNALAVARAVAAMVATTVHDEGEGAADWAVAAMTNKDAPREATFGPWKTKLSVPAAGVFTVLVTGPGT